MTALAGFWGRDGALARTVCQEMLEAQEIYGPMAPAIWSAGEIALGGRFHPVLAGPELGSSALVCSEDNLTLVADMRLDNRKALERSLALDRSLAAALSDHQLVLRFFREKGFAALARIAGDFALAIWDASTRRLILARDPIGQRPLFHTAQRAGFAFASMARGLHALADLPRQVDERQVQRFLLAQPEVTEETFFRGVRRVLPGHAVVVDSEGARSVRIWRPNLQPLHLAESQDYVTAMREKLELAVARRIRRATGTVGAQLSAGLDSNATASTAARLMENEDRRLIAFTGVPSPQFDDSNLGGDLSDEGGLAGLTVARYSNMDHVKVSGENVPPSRALALSNELYERPIPNLANMPWLIAINDAAKSRGISVLLTGQMGNWSISHNGYEMLPALFSRFRWIRLSKLIRKLHERGISWLPLISAAVLPSIPGWFKKTVRLRKREEPSPLHIRGLTEPDVSRHKYSTLARLEQIRRLDLGSYNKGTLAGWGIDLRDPTADVELIEFCLRVPVEQYILDGVPRSLALRSLADRVPVEVLIEKRRGLQGADWYLNFLRSIDDICQAMASFSQSGVLSTWVDFERVRAMLAEWTEGASKDDRTRRDFRGTLLRVLSAGHFMTSYDPGDTSARSLA